MVSVTYIYTHIPPQRTRVHFTSKSGIFSAFPADIQGKISNLHDFSSHVSSRIQD